MKKVAVLVQIVTFNHSKTIVPCIKSVLESEATQVTIQLLVTDNASLDDTVAKIQANISNASFELKTNSKNLGFGAAYNQGVQKFLEGNFDYFLILNPDLRLAPNSIQMLVSRLNSSQKFRLGAVGAKLIRADKNLQPLVPPVYDSLGIEMTQSLRHLDKCAGIELNQDLEVNEVFGITGACLLLSKPCIRESLLKRVKNENDLFLVYPQLRDGHEARPQLFDEGFFAYREDANLAWRLQLLGWKAVIEPNALGYHLRHVTPEKRQQLEPELNKLGVRNRFLLQVHNFPVWMTCNGPYWGCVFKGLIFRNLLVLFAILLRERSSLGALSELRILFRRALDQRKQILQGKQAKYTEVFEWFK